MADLAIELHAVFAKAGQRKELHLPLLEIGLTGSQASYISQAIGNVEEAIDLAEISPGGYFFAVNRSTTAGEIITLKIKTGETEGFTLNPGEVVMGRLHANAVPTAVSATGTPVLDMLVTVA